MNKHLILAMFVVQAIALSLVFTDTVRTEDGICAVLFGAAQGLCKMGLKNDGTIAAVGNSGYGRCNVSSCSDIVQGGRLLKRRSQGAWAFVFLVVLGHTMRVSDTGSLSITTAGATEITML